MRGEWLAMLFARPGARITGAEYRLGIIPAREVPAQNAGVSQLSHELNFTAPIHGDETEDWSLRGNFQNTQISSDSSLNGRGLPAQLWNATLGVGYRWRIEDRNIFGADVGLGSASDRPFHSIDEAAVHVNVLYSIPSGERNAWVFLLNYSNLRPTLNHIPLPGVAYFYHPNDNFRALLGLPFLSVHWKLDDSWTLSTFLSPFNANGQVSYTIVGPVQAYLALNWMTQTFYLMERADKNERFFHAFKSASLGLRSPVATWLYLDLSAAYLMGRSYYEGTSFSKYRGTPVEVDSGLAFLAQFRFRL